MIYKWDIRCFSITKICNIRIKWRGRQKEHIRQMIIWELRTQRTLTRLHFREQLFTAVYREKHVSYLLVVGGKVGESSRWKHVVLIEIADVASKKFWLEIFWTQKSTSNIEENTLKIGCRTVGYRLGITVIQCLTWCIQWLNSKQKGVSFSVVMVWAANQSYCCFCNEQYWSLLTEKNVYVDSQIDTKINPTQLR